MWAICVAFAMTLQRAHPVSPIIQFKIRLLQMDILKSDKVKFRYTLENGDKCSIYHKLESVFEYIHSHSKPNYESYYTGKKYVLKELIRKPEYINTNKLWANAIL